MPIEITRVVVNTTRLYNRGHLLDRWSSSVTGQIKTAARTHAPARTGDLKASIFGTHRRTGPHQISMYVGATAPHAHYVHEGTALDGKGWIYTTKGWANRAKTDAYADMGTGNPGKGYWLMVGPRNIPKLRVHGQKANPYLIRGYNDAGRLHPALGRFRGVN